jgi:tRNA pseudouridine55 synthase
VGHLGTLDPFASGLLPLCVGEGTKAATFLNTADKRYRGVVRLGVETDTLDITGEVISSTDRIPDARDLPLAELADRFTGRIQQVPPAYSAIKKDGVRMYELARAGTAPELEARAVEIHALALDALGPDRISLEVHCSKGTYVRSLARDLGRAIGCPATLAELVRTGFGPFGLADAVDLESLSQRLQAGAAAPLLDLGRALGHLRELAVRRGDAADLRLGRQAVLAGLPRPHDAAELAKVIDPDGDLVAVVSASPLGWRIERIFAASESCAPPR